MTSLTTIQRRVGAVPDGRWGPRTAKAIMAALDACGHPPAPARQLAHPEAFYKGVRAVTGPLNNTRFEIINALLAKAGHWSIAWLAYGLATAWHESRLEPVEEIGKGRGRRYGVPGPHGGQVAFGRGLVQLTHPENYARADDECKLEGALVADYGLALRPDIAVAILVRGMEEGWFTGKKLGDYLPDERGTLAQFTDARRIINGTDRDDLIAGYAMKFQVALVMGGWA